jgi:hypothetical protein
MANAKNEFEEFGGYELNPKATESNDNEFAEFGGYVVPKKQQPKNQEKNAMQQHPLIAKLAEQLQQYPALNAGVNAAAKVASPFNEAVQALGFPAAARGLLRSGPELAHAAQSLIPGAPEFQMPGVLEHEVPRTPLPFTQNIPGLPEGVSLNQPAEIAGGLVGIGKPAQGIYQGAKGIANIVPLLKKSPELLKSLLASGSTGALLSPDNRLAGAAVGAASEIPSIASALKDRSLGARQEAFTNALQEHETAKANENAPYEQQQLENIQNAIQEHLGAGQPHDVLAAERIVNHVEGNVNPQTGKREGGLRKVIGSQYQQLGNEIAGQTVKVPKDISLADIKKSVEDLGFGTATEEEQKSLMQALQKQASKGVTEINAKDFLNAYREIKHQYGKANEHAYTYGVSPKEKEEWLKKAREMKAGYEKMEQVMADQLPSNPVTKLKEINKQYATQVAPLNKNPMYLEMKNTGATSKNMINYLRGTRSGNAIIDELIKQDPELQRLIVGQSHAAKPENLLKPNELTQKYVDLNPHIKRLIQHQQNAVADLATGKEVGKERLAEALERMQREKSALQKTEKRQKSFNNKLRYAAGTLGGLLAEELYRRSGR